MSPSTAAAPASNSWPTRSFPRSGPGWPRDHPWRCLHEQQPGCRIVLRTALPPASAHPLLITDFLFRARDMFGDKEIVDHVDGAEVFRYSYRDYADRVLRLASALVASGVRPGDRVGTLAWNHRRHLELYLAVPLAGAVLHTINIRLAPDEIAYIVDHADDTMIFADPSLEHLLSVARSQRPDMPVVPIDADAGSPRSTGRRSTR